MSSQDVTPTLDNEKLAKDDAKAALDGYIVALNRCRQPV